MSDVDELPVLPRECAICGGPVLLVDELAPAEALAAVICGGAMCERHWSNFAQGVGQSHGVTLLRREEARS